MIGFCAILPGEKAKVGDTWSWQGDLLNIAGGDKLVARFELAERCEHEGHAAVLVRGTVPEGWTSKTTPKVEVEVLYDLVQGLPVRGQHSYTSASRTAKIVTTASWLKAAMSGGLAR